MSFFADVPEPEMPEPEEWTPPEWLQPSAEEIPVEVPFGQVVFRDDRVVLVLERAAVHSNGCTFTMQWHLRRREETALEWEANHHSFHGYPGVQADTLRFGMAFADGTRTTTVQAAMPQDFTTRPEGRTLRFNSQGGGGDTHRITIGGVLWAWPLPPDGPVTLVVEWRAQGVPETHVELDPIAFGELAASARPLWGE